MALWPPPTGSPNGDGHLCSTTVLRLLRKSPSYGWGVFLLGPINTKMKLGEARIFSCRPGYFANIHRNRMRRTNFRQSLLSFLKQIIPPVFYIWLVLHTCAYSIFLCSAVHERDLRINYLAAQQLYFLKKIFTFFWNITKLYSQLLCIISRTNLNI